MSKRLRKGELEATQQTVKFFETLLRASADGIVITDSTHTIIVVNETFCTFFGQRWRDVIETSMFIWIEQLNANALNRWSDLEKKVRLQGLCRNAEFEMTTKDKVSHFGVNASLLGRVADEEPGVIISIWRDVTERKHVENALLDRETTLKQAQQLAHVGNWEWNLIDNSFQMSDEMLRIYGIKGKSKFDNIKSLIDEAIHPDDQKMIRKVSDKVIADFAGEPLTYRIIRPDGKIRWIAATQPEVRCIGKDGKPTVMMGAVQDITEWKQTEEALRESEEKYRTFLEITSEGCWLINPELKTIEVNESLCKMLGYSQDEMIGETPFDFVDDENRNIFIEQTSKISVTAHRSYEITLKKKNGEDLPTYFNATTIRGKSGEMLGSFAFITDITEKKRAEEALRKSEDQYRNIFKNIQDVYYEVTLDGIIIEASPSIEDVSLYKREEIIGKSLSDIYVDPKNRDEFLKELLKNGKVTDYEALLIDKNRSQVHCSITAKLVRDKQGNPVKIIGSLCNITERKRMEESLREREETLKAILAASPVGICLSRNRIIDWTNQAMCRIWGYEEGSLLGKSTQVLYSDLEEYDRVGHQFYSEIEQKGIGQVETRWVSKDGTEIHCYLQGCPLDPSDIFKGVIVSAMDIAGLKQAEDLVHNFSQLLMKAQESERQRISRDLHDHVAQELSAVKIGLETLFDHQPGIPPEIRRRVSEMSRTLQVSIKAVRDVSYDLRPPALDEMGLVETLVQYCNDFSETNGINVDLHSAGMKKLTLDFDTEINLYRLIQESLTNIKNHADADHVTIRLVTAYPNIILRIKDNGKGFNVQERMTTITKEKRMGIRSMEQRAKLLKGEMEIQSRPMQGTKISITLPYKDKNSGSKENHIDNR